MQKLYIYIAISQLRNIYIYIPISQLRKFNGENTWKQLNIVLVYNPRNHNIPNTKRECLPVLHQSKTLKNIIKESNDYRMTIYSRRQLHNLKKYLLTKAKCLSTKEIFQEQKRMDSLSV